jgi:hypothetical protein
MAEAMIKYPARFRSPRDVLITIDIHPDISPRLVKKLGKPLVIFFIGFDLIVFYAAPPVPAPVGL